jgi:hypothetical protein
MGAYQPVTAPPNKSILITPFVPPVLALFASALNDVIPEINGIFWLAFIAFGILLCIDYSRQLTYIKSVLGKPVKSQKVLALAGMIIPVAAAFAGDLQGIASFGGDSSGGLMVGIIAGIVAGFAVINVMAIVNVPIIMTRGRHTALDAVSFVIQALLWLGMAFTAYFIYSLMYALRDPSTE